MNSHAAPEACRESDDDRVAEAREAGAHVRVLGPQGVGGPLRTQRDAQAEAYGNGQDEPLAPVDACLRNNADACTDAATEQRSNLKNTQAAGLISLQCTQHTRFWRCDIASSVHNQCAPLMATLPKRKVVTPPSTQSGMVVMRAAILPNTPMKKSQPAAARPVCRAAQRVSAITPLFCNPRTCLWNHHGSYILHKHCHRDCV